MCSVSKSTDSILLTINTRFEFEQDEISSRLYTRENGSVGDETPGQIDIDEANRIYKLLTDVFGDLNIEKHTVDEWVTVSFPTSIVSLIKID